MCNMVCPFSDVKYIIFHLEMCRKNCFRLKVKIQALLEGMMVVLYALVIIGLLWGYCSHAILFT